MLFFIGNNTVPDSAKKNSEEGLPIKDMANIQNPSTSGFVDGGVEWVNKTRKHANILKLSI